MRLKTLQVSGFKSFVDSTDIRLPADLVAVVGPNGCGKSNVIDAVRWVMGESSAKMLRGDSMTDVIFNGSTSRKPVSKASVELLFDNSDGAAGGNFASFAEISVQRTLSRDGNSNYFINGIKTRRKDVLDLFRGTGLGARSYSIIEQGMVSRIIEARPDELRNFVEEAAGTSKYKERRRETETRIDHTRENLDRVSDIRDELDKQLRRLKRQAGIANRYKTLKDEQRLASGQLLMLRLAAMNEKLAEQDRLSAQYENNLEAARATQRKSEAEIEKLRKQQAEAQESNQKVQQEYYGLGSEISAIEQRVKHLNETEQQQSEEIKRLNSVQAECQQQLRDERAQLNKMQTNQTTILKEAAQLRQLNQRAEEQLAEAEANLNNWQTAWEAFNEQSQTPAQQQEVQQSRIEQLEQHLKRSTEQTTRLEEELGTAQKLLGSINIDAIRAKVTQHDEICEQREKEFQQTEDSLQSLQEQSQLKRNKDAEIKAQQHEGQSRLLSLKQIQEAALSGDDQALQDWFTKNGLGSHPKLAEQIRVADGWQRAADRLMTDFFGAVCVTNLPHDVLNDRPDCAFTLVTNQSKTNSAFNNDSGNNSNAPRLLDKVTAEDTDLSAFLGGVYIANSMSEAVAMQPNLGDRECVVTQDGVLVGANWISFASQSQLETGVLAREEEIQHLQENLEQIETKSATIENELAELEKQHTTQQQERQQQQEALNKLGTERTDMHSEFSREEARYREAEQRIAALNTEIASLNQHVKNDEKEISNAQELLRIAADQSGTLKSKRNTLQNQKTQHQDNVTRCKDELRDANEKVHEQALQQQSLNADVESATASIARIEQQLSDANEQRKKISDASEKPGGSVDDLKTELQRMLDRQLEIEQRMSASTDTLTGLEENVKNTSSEITTQVEEVNFAQETLTQHRLVRQETVVRRDTLAEQLNHEDYDKELLLEQMPKPASVEKLEATCEKLGSKIENIGAVNLVAIEEYNEESERKEYLDKQHADLTEALETLRSVIRKIDGETRSLFQETFDQLNAGFKDFFPKLFGGGKVDLQLTSDDYLTAGVIVMARPPGKRNSHIHLLSGGEKALTAVALLFALFKLNPAPFCMLDEVDAPLDDANVERYCDALKSLVEISQIIVVTHNKITMECADILVGVTMSEPGVSRLVSVDIEQAAALAEQ